MNHNGRESKLSPLRRVSKPLYCYGIWETAQNSNIATFTNEGYSTYSDAGRLLCIASLCLRLETPTRTTGIRTASSTIKTIR